MKKLIYNLIFAVLIFIALITALTTINIPRGLKLLTVLSGSMEPAIKTGSLIVIKPFENYQQNDIITVQNPLDPTTSFTHRIVEINKSEDTIFFITKGDANDTPDNRQISKNEILGKMVFTIPFFGYFINFSKTPPGLIMIIIIPSLVFVSGEMINIQKEIKKIIKNKKDAKK